MPDNYIGEIMLFPGNFVPADFLPCNGQLVAIQQYTPLYSLLGTIYGGDGRTTFGLPNLSGRVPVGLATTGSNFIRMGQQGGAQAVALDLTQLPTHNHGVTATWSAALQVSVDNGDVVNPVEGCHLSAGYFDGPVRDHDVEIYNGGPPNTPLASVPLSVSASLLGQGQGGPHDNMQPYLVMNFCICANGIYPPPPD